MDPTNTTTVPTAPAPTPAAPSTEQWAIVELMGHVKYGGRISKDTEFGTGLIRLDVPQADGTAITQLINPSSLYRLTFCTEALATAAAKQGNPQPYNEWELKHLLNSQDQDPDQAILNLNLTSGQDERDDDEEEFFRP